MHQRQSVPQPPDSAAGFGFPLYRATFAEAIGRFFAQCNRFSGRASRSEFWWAMAFISLVRLSLLAQLLFAFLFATTFAQLTGAEYSPAAVVYTLVLFGLVEAALILPMFALTSRRLHDVSAPGLLAFLWLIPPGILIIWILGLLPSSPLADRYCPAAHPGRTPAVAAAASGRTDLPLVQRRPGGSRFWALGFLWFIPYLGTFGYPVLAFVLARNERDSADQLARENSRWAANWALSLTPVSVVLFATLSFVDSFHPKYQITAKLLLWAYGIANLVITVLGTARGNRQVFRPVLAAPFIKAVA